MGEAKRRGTFEERKAEAIKAGRVKNSITRKISKNDLLSLDLALLELMYLLKGSKNR